MVFLLYCTPSPRPEGQGLHAAQALALRAGYFPIKFCSGFINCSSIVFAITWFVEISFRTFTGAQFQVLLPHLR
jgi:hypothetical protein